jgi:hypothetical protein
MAKLNELKEIRGTIDDLVFYTLNGVQVVRKKSGFSTEAFANNPNYKKVKENSTEFGHCSKASKMYRVALANYIADCGDKLMYQKFTKVMTNIKNLDCQSEHGKRRIEIGLLHNESINLLRQFQFGEILNVEKVAQKDFGLFNDSLAINSNADEAILLYLKPNFSDYTMNLKEEKHILKSKNTLIEIEKWEQNAAKNQLFLVLMKKNKITNMGFL